MREIKFRAWDMARNKFFEPIYEASDGKLLDLSISLSGRLIRRSSSTNAEDESRFPNMYKIQQFTGLKDKNGKEIYEGDIVHWDDDIGIIVFEGAGWKVHIEKLKLPQVFYDWTVCRFKVIGNIYENPELVSNSNSN